jgi:hypothetical protein
MGTELVPETLYSNELKRLCAREDYTESCRRESFKTYKYSQVYANISDAAKISNLLNNQPVIQPRRPKATSRPFEPPSRWQTDLPTNLLTDLRIEHVIDLPIN